MGEKKIAKKKALKYPWEVLHASAELLDKDGWIQGSEYETPEEWFDDEKETMVHRGGHCSIGAIQRVVTGDAHDKDGALVRQTKEFFARALGLKFRAPVIERDEDGEIIDDDADQESLDDVIADWNDNTKRKGKDVINSFRRLAKDKRVRQIYQLETSKEDQIKKLEEEKAKKIAKLEAELKKAKKGLDGILRKGA